MKPCAGRAASLLLCALLALTRPTAEAAEALLDFTPQERQRIVQHGPWPLPPARDAGNAVAGRADAVALGQTLFFDARLSPDGRFACATCHAPALAFADGRARSLGRDILDRNAPSLWNAGHERWYGWDGAADSLWSQAIRPLLDQREMAASPDHITRLVAGDPALACRFRAVFGAADDPRQDARLVQAAKALGAFVASLQSARAPFDDFRDALARGDDAAAARFPPAAQRGLRLFIGRGRCSTCHGGPMFSHGEFADGGLPFFVRPGVVDPGRHGGIAALRASGYNLLSAWSDASEAEAVKTRHVEPQHRNFGEFKVPSLRNVAHTAPYMHDGQLATLADVVRHYAELNLERLHADGEQILQPVPMTPGEQADLLAFLESLGDPAARRWTPRADALESACPRNPTRPPR